MEKIIYISKSMMDAKYSMRAEQDIEITDNEIIATVHTKVNDIIRDNSITIDLNNLEENHMYSIKYNIEGYFPYIGMDDYSIRNDDSEAFRFYLSANKEIIELEFFTKINLQKQNDIIIKNSDVSPTGFIFNFKQHIKDTYPEYKNGYSLEKDSMGDMLNAHKSLSYMDAQIDIVTKLLMAILEKEKKNLSPESKKLYEEFKKIFDETSLLKLMSVEKMKKKFRHKVTTRNYQKQRKEIFNEG